MNSICLTAVTELDALESLDWIDFEDDGWPEISGYTLNFDFDQPIIFGPEVDPYHYVLSANIHRRHLTAAQKRELITAVLKAHSAKSNRTIAKQTKADHKTVGAVRERLEAGGEIPHHDLRQDARGTQQPAHRARQQAKAEHRANRELALAAKITALPDKRYGVILADPPWRFEPWSRDTGMDRAADNHYPTMTTDEICRLGVPSIAADDALLFLWATAPMLPHALFVIEAWGFTYKTNMVWVKDKIGTGYRVRNQHGLLLIAQRGTVPLPAQVPASVIAAPRLEHSAKPVTVCALIEAMHPDLPRVELFARQTRLGWDAWGNEAPTPEPATAGNAVDDDLGIPDFLKRSPPLQAEQAQGVDQRQQITNAERKDAEALAVIQRKQADRKKAKALVRIETMKATKRGDTKRMPLTGKAAAAAVKDEADQHRAGRQPATREETDHVPTG